MANETPSKAKKPKEKTPKTETIMKRRLVVYLPNENDVERWKEHADKRGLKISKLIHGAVEREISEVENGKHVDAAKLIEENETLKTEMATINEDLHQAKLLNTRLEEELETYRGRPFTDPEYRGHRDWDRDLIALLKENNPIKDDDILSKLRVTTPAAAKDIREQLKGLKRDNRVKPTANGWVWKG